MRFRATADDPDDPKVYQRLKKNMLAEMKKMFRPEFLNRVDEVIVFQHLNRSHILRIADLYMARVYKQCAELGIEISLTDKLKDLLVKEGYDPNMGARPLRRAVQSLIENPLSEEMLKGGLESGKHYVVDCDDEGAVSISECVVPLEKTKPKRKKTESKPLEENAIQEQES